MLAATAGTARHALVADEQLRSLFAYLRTLTTPTARVRRARGLGLDPALAERVDRAAHELVVLMESGFARAMQGRVRHELPARVRQRRGGTETAIDFDTDLMRLATGGSAG